MSYTHYEFEKRLNRLGYSYKHDRQGRDDYYYLESKRSHQMKVFCWNGKPTQVIPEKIMDDMIEYIINECDIDGYNEKK